MALQSIKIIVQSNVDLEGARLHSEWFGCVYCRVSSLSLVPGGKDDKSVRLWGV